MPTVIRLRSSTSHEPHLKEDGLSLWDDFIKEMLKIQPGCARTLVKRLQQLRGCTSLHDWSLQNLKNRWLTTEMCQEDLIYSTKSKDSSVHSNWTRPPVAAVHGEGWPLRKNHTKCGFDRSIRFRFDPVNPSRQRTQLWGPAALTSHSE